MKMPIIDEGRGDLGGAAQTQASELDITQELNNAIGALEGFKLFVEAAILQAGGLSIAAGIAAMQIAAKTSEGQTLISNTKGSAITSIHGAKGDALTAIWDAASQAERHHKDSGYGISNPR